MDVTKIYTSTETCRKLTPEELEIGQKVLKTNMGLKPTESLLVVTNPQMEKEEAAIWFEAGKTIAKRTQMVVFSGMTENAQEPPAIVAMMMARSNVGLLQTSYSLTHTDARKRANAAGARIASLPTVTKDIIMRTLNMDYQPIAALSTKVANLLTKANKAVITSPNGTNLTLDLTERTAIADTGFFTQPGDFGNLPAGESFLAPVEGKTQGVYVVDGSFADIKLDKSMTITVKDGLATAISGDKAAQTLTGRLDAIGPKARNIAELGVGTNPKANPKGSLIEAEKAYGTVHIALGNNAGFGGIISVPFHSDGVIVNPTLSLGGTIILKDGEFRL